MPQSVSHRLPWAAPFLIGVLAFCPAAPSLAADHDLAVILADLREYEVPMPPKDAPLMLCMGSDKPDEKGVLGFLVKPQADPATHRLIVGGNDRELRYFFKITPVAPGDVKLDALRYIEWATFPSALLTAVQCQARGWDEFAKNLWQRAIQENDKDPGTFVYPRTKIGQSDSHAIAGTLAFCYYFDRLHNHDADWRLVARRMVKIRRPTADPWEDYYLETIALALKPSGAKPGSPEALIDGLIESSYFEQRENRKVAEQGFVAMEALIQHADDRRWTRAHTMGINNIPSRALTVGDLALELLQEFAADNDEDWRTHFFANDDDEVGEKPFSPEKAKRWFAEARRVGEEAYLVGHAFTKPTEWNPEVSAKRAVFWAVAAKYPHRLPQLYHELLSHPSRRNAATFVEIIAQSSLAKQEKIALFAAGGLHADFGHRVAAVEAMSRLDRERFISLLRRALEEIPRTPSTDYGEWPADNLVWLVAQSKDSTSNDLLLAAGRRVDVGLKMELIQSVGECTSDEGDWPKYRKQFLSQFLNDATLRDERSDEKYEGINAGSTFERLEVRNLAAMQLAKILEWKDDPTSDWTADQHQGLGGAE